MYNILLSLSLLALEKTHIPIHYFFPPSASESEEEKRRLYIVFSYGAKQINKLINKSIRWIFIARLGGRGTVWAGGGSGRCRWRAKNGCYICMQERKGEKKEKKRGGAKMMKGR